MSNEQNIDDILKLLRDSVSVESADISEDTSPISEQNISNDELEKQLKSQYLDNSSAVSSSYEPQREYIIDSDFLTELENQPQKAEDVQEVPVADGAVMTKEAEIFDDEADEDEVLITETDAEFAHDETEDTEWSVDEPFEEEFNDDSTEYTLSKESIDETISRLAPEPQEEPVMEALTEEGATFEEISEEYEDIVFADENVDEDDLVFEIEEPKEENEISDEVEEAIPHETFLASMRKTGMDFTTNDMCKNTDNEAEEITSENPSEEPIDGEELDISTINLMMQFCEKEELAETIGNDKVEEFLIFEQTDEVEHSIPAKALDGHEYMSDEQTQTITDTYKKNRMSVLWSMIGCSIIAFVSFLYELMPVLDVRLSGILDYVKYPAIYALLGLQFVVFAAAICYKQLWIGLKRAFSLTPNTHSIVAIILSLTAIYDLIIVIVLAFSGDALPPIYNGVAVIITAVVAISDYLDIYSEERSFKIYSSKSDKYTLLHETAKTGIGAKMYGGGLDTSKVVYSAHHVDFPRGFFRSVNQNEKKNSVLTLSIIPIIVIGMIAAIISVVLGADAYSSCAAFMLALYAILPISLIFSESLSGTISAVRLAKRGSAFAGNSAYGTYSECDIIVFDDTHMFKKCNTSDVGFAIYDTSVGYLALGCLDALFAHIGGPLSGMKMESLPDVFRFNNVNVKRIARNGVEAIIENRYSIIVGDHEFMKRYGLDFPKDEKSNGRSTLCVSLNGKITAKLSVKYQTEPEFEMLVERLHAEGVAVAIRTADPMISSKSAAAARTLGNAPVSVIHLSIDDIEAAAANYREEADGVVACQSRTKLGEAVVWAKRLKKAKKLCGIITAAFSGVGVLALALLVIFGATGYVNQFIVLLYLLLEFAAIAGVILALLPMSKYFTVNSLNAELEKAKMKK